MNSRIRSFFSGSERRSSASTSPTSSHGLNDNYALQGQSYNRVAPDAPIHGSYPVAGNEPDVFVQINQPNARVNSDRASTSTTRTGDGATPPVVPRYRGESISHQPHTSLDNRRKKWSKSIPTNNTHERTRSGFSVKPPGLPHIRRSLSTQRPYQYKNDESPSIPIPSLPIPSILTTINTSVPTRPAGSYKSVPIYKPSHGPTASSVTYASFTSTLSQQNPRQFKPRAAHVDLLDAYSNNNQSHDISKHRVKASGVRNYGEDVADRNIAQATKNKLMTPRVDSSASSGLDTSNLEFSYLTSVYSKSKIRGTKESNSDAASALGYILGNDDDIGGETKQIFTSSHGSHSLSVPQSSLRSFTGSRLGMVYPPRTRQLHSIHSSSSLDYASDEDYDRSGRTLSPRSIDEEPQQGSVSSTRVGYTPVVPLRGRPRYKTTYAPNTARQPSIPKPNLVRKSSVVAGIVPSERSHGAQASMSSIVAHRRAQSTSKSRNYSASPKINHAQDRESTRSQISHTRPMIVDGAKEAPSLEDVTHTVDTDISIKALPAVVQENVTPTRHEIRDEHITREIHNHDVYHRVLPIIQTEILPTKHYVLARDGKSLIEIPESMIPGRSANGSPHRNWEIIETSHGTKHVSILHRTSTEAFDRPVIGRARLEAAPESGSESSASSTATSISFPNHPILASKRESLTQDGISHTEYTWRHPPVYEVDGQATKQTAPLYIGAGIGDISAPQWSEDDEQTSEFEFVRTPAKEEEEFLFRDSGYGSGGMLPGLLEKSTSPPTSILPRLRKAFSRGSDIEEREPSRGRKKVREVEKGKGVADVEKGVKLLDLSN